MESGRGYCTIYIVRHGQTGHNINKIISGQTDSLLSEEGEKQAKELAKDLAGIHFDAIFSSDLIRAKRTAEIIALSRKLAINTTRLIRERHFGAFEGRPVTELSLENQAMLEQINMLTEQQRLDFKIYNDFESTGQVLSRMLTFLREVSITYLGGKILVVSHGSIMRALLAHLGFALQKELVPGSIENTGYAILESDGVDFFVKSTHGITKTIV